MSAPVRLLTIAFIAALAISAVAPLADASRARSQSLSSHLLSTPVVGSGVVSRSPAAATFDEGEVVRLMPSANVGWRFDHWEVDAEGSDFPLDIVMTREKTVRAVFVPDGTDQLIDRNRLVIELAGDCCGTVAPDHGESGAIGVYEYLPGEDVVLTASTSTANLQFSHWEGGAVGTVPVTIVRMDSNKVVRAVFVLSAPQRYPLTADVAGSGLVIVDPDRESYVAGDEITVIAVPGQGWRFDRWEGEPLFSPVRTVAIAGETRLRAVFVEASTRPSLSVVVSGAGTVRTDGEALGAGDDDRSYEPGAEVTVTATPAAGWRFVRWTGDAAGVDATKTVQMNGNRAVRATFVSAMPDIVSVSTEVSGLGAVAQSPEGPGYDIGTRVALIATPANGWRFARWEQDIAGSSAVTKVTASANLAVRAVFVAAPVGYQLSSEVTGSGDVVGSPFSSEYSPGTIVTLIATPAWGWRFDRWEGDVSGTSPTTTVTMEGDRNVRAFFEFDPPPLVALTVEISGNGSVGPVPDGALYSAGTEIQLQATPDDGWRFGRWDGDVLAVVNPLEFDLAEAATVRALFVPEDEYTLWTLLDGSGSVLVEPSGGSYVPGTSVTLIPAPSSGWRFDRWEGAASGSSASVTVTMSGDSVVRAVFVSGEPTTSVGSGTYVALPDSGTGLAVFNGGTVAQASAGFASIWTADAEGGWVQYLVGAPEIMNQRFLDLFPDGIIPPATPLYVIAE